MSWQLPPHAGPKLDITAKGTGRYPFPYKPDERTEDEIQQQQFDQMQQRWEFEREQEASRTINKY